MARARSDRTMTMEELCEALDAEHPWPSSDEYTGDGGAEDYAMHAEAARRRIRVALRLGFDRYEAFLASHRRDHLPMREKENPHDG